MSQQPSKPDAELTGRPIRVGAGSSLLRSSGVVSVMTLLSRVFGLVRDVVVAALFGASSGADAFFVAFKIPNFFRRLFAEGAFSQAFVPVLSEYRSRNSDKDVRALADSVAGVLGMILLVLTILAVASSEALTWLFAPGFADDANKFGLASEMLRITFPYLMMISLTALAGSILNSYGYFAVPAFTPVLLNLVLISAALWLTPWFSEPIIGLAWGVFIAGLVQLFFQFPFLMRMGLLPRPRLDYRHEGVRRIFRLMLPALFGVSVSQLNLLLDTILASFLQTGSISWLYYSDRLAELPLGVIGIAIATVILPSLSRKHADQSSQAFSDTMDWALRMVILIGVPAATALIVLAEPLVTTIFYYGEMTRFDVMMASASLRAYALGLLAFMLIKVLAPGYFARQDMKTPVRIGIYAMAANMVFNLLLIWHLEHVGLALATALSSWLNAYWLYRGLRQADIFRPAVGWGMFVARIVLASVIMACAVAWFAEPDFVWFSAGLWSRIWNVAILVCLGVVLYFATLQLSGLSLPALVRKVRH